MKSVPTIYEDEHILVLNKPAGLMVHGDGRTKEETLADKLLAEYPALKEVGEPMEIQGKTLYRPGIVHRLDKDTSGVMVVAKDEETFQSLKKQFQERVVKKTYIAIAHGTIKEEKGTIDRPLGRSPKDFREVSAHATARGELREAVTDWRVLGRFSTNEGDFTALEVSPRTGRTHQIRAHLKFINHPVVCDATYAGKRGCALGLSRLALHAAKLEFAMPDGTRRSFDAPLAEDIKDALKIDKEERFG